MKNVFVIAMEVEADAVLRHMQNTLRFEESGRIVYQGELGGEPTAVVIAGVGKVNAAAGTQYAIDHFAPERIVNIGVAGGIDASMKIAEVYEVSKCFQCDFDLSILNHTPKGTVNEYDTPWFKLAPFEASRVARRTMGESLVGHSAYNELPSAIVATGDFFANDDHDRGFVHDEMGAWLREMELGAIAHVCKRAGVKCSALKAVSDVNYPGCPPPTEQYAVNLKRAVDALAEKVKSHCMPSDPRGDALVSHSRYNDSAGAASAGHCTPSDPRGFEEAK